MSDVALDLNPASSTYKDFLLQNNDLVITDGKQEILQHILQRLSFFFGEWFLDTTQGFPWFEQVFVKNPDQGAIDALFKDTIMDTPGVIQLNTYNFTPNMRNRTLNVSFVAMTTAGKVDYSGTTPTG